MEETKKELLERVMEKLWAIESCGCGVQFPKGCYHNEVRAVIQEEIEMLHNPQAK